jgi:hypothetical protein
MYDGTPVLHPVMGADSAAAQAVAGTSAAQAIAAGNNEMKRKRGAGVLAKDIRLLSTGVVRGMDSRRQDV